MLKAKAQPRKMAKDRAWLAKMTNALNQHWQRKNAAKRDNVDSRVQPFL